VEVFEKPPDFDPRLDATVRVRASKLRSELETYYSTVGRTDDVPITLPKGHYVPEIVRRSASEKCDVGFTVEDAPASLSARSKTRWISWAAVLMTALVIGALGYALRTRTVSSPRGPSAHSGRVRVGSACSLIAWAHS
jgi:hypothetical protein